MNSAETFPLISVFMPTYNHVNFIEEAVENCMAQQTEYPFELVVCDDFSTDGTREKLEKLKKSHPNMILSFQPHNTRGVLNMMQGLSLCKGKYLAMCEGDDYWTDPQKLQKQVSFLENNPDFTVSTHRVEMLYVDGGDIPALPKYVYKDCTADEQRIKDGIFFADEVVSNYYMHTSSLVLRWKYRKGLPDTFRSRMLLDHFLFLLHAAEGKIKYFDEPMSIWRRHINSYSYAQLHDKGIFFQKEGDDWINVYNEIDQYFHGRFHLQIRERIMLALRAMTDYYMKTGQHEKLMALYKRNWNILKEGVLNNGPIIDAMRIIFPENREFSPPWASDTEKETSPGLSVPARPLLELNFLPECRDNVWKHWTEGHEWASFANAKSAIAAFCVYYGISTIWLPSICPLDLGRALGDLQMSGKVYPVNENLESEPDFLKLVSPGEAVLTINWFGRPLNSGMRKALEARKDIYWLEDRALCVTGTKSNASAVVYSMHKVFGVPDGGLLVGKGMNALQPKKTAQPAIEKISAFMLNYENQGKNFLAEREAEQKIQLPAGPASLTTLNLLKKLSYSRICKANKANWRFLYSELEPYAFWKIPNPGFVPTFFPILIPQGFLASVFVGELVRNGIEANSLSVISKDCFADSLAQRLVVLPCGHHLSKDQLSHMVSIIKKQFGNERNDMLKSQRSAK